MSDKIRDLEHALDLARTARTVANEERARLAEEHRLAGEAYTTVAAAYDADPTDKAGRELLRARDARDLLAVRLTSAEKRATVAQGSVVEHEAALVRGRARAHLDALEAKLAPEIAPYLSPIRAPLASPFVAPVGYSAKADEVRAAREALAALDPAFAAELHAAKLDAARRAVTNAAIEVRQAHAAAHEADVVKNNTTIGATIAGALALLALDEQSAKDVAAQATVDLGAKRNALESSRDTLAALDPDFAASLPELRAQENSAEAAKVSALRLERGSVPGLRAALAPAIALHREARRIKALADATGDAATRAHDADRAAAGLGPLPFHNTNNLWGSMSLARTIIAHELLEGPPGSGFWHEATARIGSHWPPGMTAAEWWERLMAGETAEEIHAVNTARGRAAGAQADAAQVARTTDPIVKARFAAIELGRAREHDVWSAPRETRESALLAILVTGYRAAMHAARDLKGFYVHGNEQRLTYDASAPIESRIGELLLARARVHVDRALLGELRELERSLPAATPPASDALASAHASN